MNHRAELARFIGDGETRQLYALDRHSGRIVYLTEGDADSFRDGCRTGQLICPIDSCASPAFVAHGGTLRRHHFKHKTIVAAHESYYHQLGKQLLGQHLQDRYPKARVVVDQEAIDNGQKPDVLVEFHDGRRFAFELQYSSLTVAAWRRRHDGYRRERINDIWILGHLPPQLRRSRHHSEQRFAWTVELHGLAQAILDTGAPLLFFNPDERRIATATIESGENFVRSWDAAELAYDALDSCEIRGRRFWTASLDAEREARIARRRETIEARKRLAADDAVELQRRARQLAKEQNDRAFAGRLRLQRAAQTEAWRKALPEFLRLVELDAVPPVVAIELKTDWSTCWHPAHWHARLFYEFIESRLGETFSYAAARRHLFKAQPHGKKRAYIGLRAYLFELRRRGYLRFDNDGYTVYDEILVLADLKHPPSSRLAAELLYGLLATEGGDVVYATRTGQVLQRLRACRENDHLTDVAELQAREQQRLQRLAAQEWANDPRRRLDVRDVIVERDSEQLTVYLFSDLWPTFRGQLMEVAARHPGDLRLCAIVYSRNDGSVREITLATRADAGETFLAEVEALAVSASRSPLAA